MNKLIETLGLTFLFGALVGALEGIGLMHFIGLRFRQPLSEVVDIQWQYGLIGLVFIPIAFGMAKLCRLPHKAGVELASWSFLGFAWVILNWWIQGQVFRNEPITSMRSLGVLLVSGLLVFVLFWVIRKIQGKAALGFLIAALLALPAYAQLSFQRHTPPPTTPASSENMPDITVVVIDTLRADHLGMYGYERPDGERTSPFLDGLAEQGMVFEKAWSQAPWTRPSMAALHSGLFCSGHTVNETLDMLPDDVVTMAEMAHSMGYRTGGFSANANVGVTYGFDQGFEKLWTVGQQRTLTSYSRWGELQHKVINQMLGGFLWDGADYAELVNAKTFEWLDSVASDTRPKFTYVHYIDPHTPYAPPEGGWHFATGPDDLSVLQQYLGKRGNVEEFPFGAFDDPGQDIIDLVIKAYDAEIRYVDGEMENLVAKLKELGQLDDNDWLIITADHGEEFYERGGWGHGHSLFEDQIHVPLIVLGPDMHNGKRQAQEVNLLDVHTTIADVTGFTPRPLSPGVSLRPLGDGEYHEDEERILFSERLQGTRKLYAARKADQKIITRVGDRAAQGEEVEFDELTMWFDLEINPEEHPGFDFRTLIDSPNQGWRELPVFQDPPDELAALMEYARKPEYAQKGAVKSALAQMSAQDLKTMQDLGYLDENLKPIAGGAGHAVTSDNEKND